LPKFSNFKLNFAKVLKFYIFHFLFSPFTLIL
jgi:hypothetical protein